MIGSNNNIDSKAEKRVDPLGETMEEGSTSTNTEGTMVTSESQEDPKEHKNSPSTQDSEIAGVFLKYLDTITQQQLDFMTKQLEIERKEAKEERERFWEIQMKKKRERKEEHGRLAELIRANVYSGGNDSCESSMKDNILRGIN